MCCYGTAGKADSSQEQVTNLKQLYFMTMNMLEALHRFSVWVIGVSPQYLGQMGDLLSATGVLQVDEDTITVFLLMVARKAGSRAGNRCIPAFRS